MRESTIVEDAFYMPSTIEVGSTESIQNGYISSLQMNNEKIGLWNFVDTDGTCDGTASEETSLEKGESYYFLKDAYKKYEKSNLNVKEIGMTFTFATFDENSVIYLAQDTNVSDSVNNLNSSFKHFFFFSESVVFHSAPTGRRPHKTPRAAHRRHGNRFGHGKSIQRRRDECGGDRNAVQRFNRKVQFNN